MTLAVQKLTHYFNHPDDYLYKDVSLKFESSKFYAIVGESGSGKTTFVSFLAGLDSPAAGTINFNGKDIRKIGLTKYRNQDVTIIFQAYNLMTYMSALENVMSALSITNSKHAGDKQYATDLLASVGIDGDLINKNVQKLSGGQQQRVAIIRALAVDAPVVVADEPTGNLDSQNTKEITQIFKKVAHDSKKTVIVITHDQKVASMADVKIVLDDRKFTVKKPRKRVSKLRKIS
ncbi:ABC transporter [Oenococcus oeni]|uniref:ABC transporter ATP-binding protein n=1 Tax=Oenococcus oeni TaxID=1247 RepID=UPI0008F8843C|nr:ABC transporter ATP-binding protein [Oenococcus oeni]OIK57633.1 ABC transporter [Oenococcus oeni]OIK88189.1 ABC transporter [Oenococcus oeni]OIL10182.1 ABC transporter [Oenococcus oeni]OIL15734.1 ABC transporter [Oenococcus oeni]OIM26099.1 ABC transporter [Oenococcus oeni]